MNLQNKNKQLLWKEVPACLIANDRFHFFSRTGDNWTLSDNYDILYVWQSDKWEANRVCNENKRSEINLEKMKASKECDWPNVKALLTKTAAISTYKTMKVVR